MKHLLLPAALLLAGCIPTMADEPSFVRVVDAEWQSLSDCTYQQIIKMDDFDVRNSTYTPMASQKRGLFMLAATIVKMEIREVGPTKSQVTIWAAKTLPGVPSWEGRAFAPVSACLASLPNPAAPRS